MCCKKGHMVLIGEHRIARGICVKRGELKHSSTWLMECPEQDTICYRGDVLVTQEKVL